MMQNVNQPNQANGISSILGEESDFLFSALGFFFFKFYSEVL